jgi:hypothetical protein
MLLIIVVFFGKNKDMVRTAVISILFDYPNHFIPTFENKLLKDFNQEDYHVVRYVSENESVKNESYYFKFTHFRIKNFVSFIEENILGKYDYFILLDATDIGYVGDIQNIPNIMEEYKCNILFGAERNLWPNTDYSHLHENKEIPTPYKFLNAGAFCAKPDSFVLHVKEILKRGLVGLCDQGNWQIEYLLNSDIELDYNNKLVLNSYLAKDDLIIGDDGIKFKTNTPIFVHDNGGYNDDTIKIMEYFK